MAQRFNRNANHEEPFASKFKKDPKQVTNFNRQSGGDLMRCSQHCSTSSIKGGRTVPNLPGIPVPKPRPNSGRPIANRAGSSEVRKEVLSNDNATVEVTVRTHSRNRNLKGETREKDPAWASILGVKASEGTTSFNNFDPLRTLHFLGQELQSKLSGISSGDPNVLQMVADMQVALNRIPPEVASVLSVDHRPIALPPPPKVHSNKQMNHQFCKDHCAEVPEKLVKPLPPTVEEKCCQTVESVSNFYESQKRLEEQTNKFHDDCKHLEKQVMKMNNDKDQLERLLNAERDTVKFLRKQIEDIQCQKVDTTSVAFQALMQERDLLRSRVKKLEKNENRPQSSLQEYKHIIDELQAEKAAIKQESIALRHKLTISNMEKEKFDAILSVRDRQITEIRSEMTQLQEAVNEQLAELQQSTFLSSPSSQSTFIDNVNGGIWQQLQTSLEKCDSGKTVQHERHLTPPTNDTPFNQLFGKGGLQHPLNSDFRELPSGDSSSTNFDPIALKMKRGLPKKGTASEKSRMLPKVEEIKQN